MVPSDTELISEAQRVFFEDGLRAGRLVGYGLLPLATLLLWAVWNRGTLVIATTLLFLAAAAVLGGASILKTAARPLFKSDRFLAGCSTAMTCGAVGVLLLSWLPVAVGLPGLLIMLLYGPLVGSVLWHAATPIMVFNALEQLPDRPLPEAERYVLHCYLLDADSVGHGLEDSFAELAKSTVTMGSLRAAEAAQIGFLMFFQLVFAKGTPGLNLVTVGVPIGWLILAGLDLEARGRRERPAFVLPPAE